LKIRFHYRSASWHLRNAGAHKLWLERVLHMEDKAMDLISYVFTSNEEIRSINIEFLNHDYDTDVITFDYSTTGITHGEVYVGIDTVKKNAYDIGVTFGEEVRRVLVHALLHLCGYDDADETGTREMRMLEDKYLEYYRNEF
jgi:probable rRNA maturation factor